MRTKNSIQWSEPAEIIWFLSQLKEPKSHSDMVTLCMSRYNTDKIAAASVYNQLDRVGKIIPLKCTGKRPVRFQLETPMSYKDIEVKVLNQVGSMNKVIKSSGSSTTESSSSIRIDTLKNARRIFEILKDHNMTMTWDDLALEFEISSGIELTTHKLDSINTQLLPILKFIPFGWSSKNEITYKFGWESANDCFEHEVNKLIHKKETYSEVDDNLALDETEWTKILLIYGEIIHDNNGILFDNIPSIWYTRTKQMIKRETLSQISKSLMTKCSGIYVVKDRRCYIRNYSEFQALLNPKLKEFDVVIELNVILGKLPENIIKTYPATTDQTQIIVFHSKNDDNLSQYLRSLYATRTGKVIYPVEIGDKIQSDWDVYVERFSSL